MSWAWRQGDFETQAGDLFEAGVTAHEQVEDQPLHLDDHENACRARAAAVSGLFEAGGMGRSRVASIGSLDRLLA